MELTNHDDKYAYFAVVTKNNTTIDPRLNLLCSLGLDTLHDAASRPQADDYRFSIVWKNEREYDVRTVQGTGDSWKLIDNPPDLKEASGLTKTPFRDLEVLIYEYAIPKSMIGDSKTMGIIYRTVDTQTVGWPTTDVDTPSSWDDVIFKDEKILPNEIIVPEFPYAKEAILAGSLLLVERLLRNRKNELTKLNYKV